ncbi:uncharacterized protein LOC127650285 [Xyrauchen texanus]|uniref:uncharacterized protein LOC127650285 n=1 Tax=Xyrauchen texanus TaxID=154827 RepID=UPI0022428642|nr:uncharacterized protein LOC127650285 [Xyrauchen texanus]
MITDHRLDALCLTETWLKPDEYISLNESTPPGYCYKHEPRLKGRGGGVATIYSEVFGVTQRTGYKCKSFELIMLNVTPSNTNKKSLSSFTLSTVYRSPGPYSDFLSEFANFLSDLVVTVDRALIVGDFNIHIHNENDTLGLAFIDILNSLGVRQNVTGPTHRHNHTLDLILSYGVDVDNIEILQQSDDISDHYLVSCMLQSANVTQSTPRYRSGRTILSTTKDDFTNTLPDLSHILSKPQSPEELDEITKNLNAVFSSTLDVVAPLRLKKIKEISPAPWYNDHTHALKRAARKMELCGKIQN